LRKAKEDTDKVNILLALSNELVNIGDTNGMKYAYNAKEIAEGGAFKKGIARAMHVIGRAYYGQGNYEVAKEFFLQSVKIKIEIGDQLGIADSYNSIGLIYQNEGSYPEALKNYLLALKIYEQVGNSKKGIANVYMNTGSIYLYQGNYAEALKNYFQSVKMMEQIGNKRGMALDYSNIGIVYSLQKNNELALKNYRLALQLNEEIGNIEQIAANYNNIGLIYYDEANYSEALKNYFMSLKTSEGNGNKQNMANVYNSIGNTYIKQKKFNEAKKYLNDCLLLSKEIGSKNILGECYRSLATLAEAAGDYKSAYQYHQLFSDIKDSLLNESNSQQIAEMKTKYETEKKDKDIELLNKDKEIQLEKIGKQKATIRYFIGGSAVFIIFSFLSFRLYNQKRKAKFMQQVAETKMKALRAQMNPHFIFNSLNSVYRYMQVNDFKSAGEYLISFSKLIRLILENSLYNEIPLSDELKALELFLSLESTRLNKKFVYEIHVAGDIDQENTLIPPLLLEPFIENSIWHGFKEKEGQGKITLSISKQDGKMKCIIEDNGVGRKKSSQTPPDVNGGVKTSVGMKLTEERISTMNQAINSKSQVTITDLFDEMKHPAGVRVELLLPLQLND